MFILNALANLLSQGQSVFGPRIVAFGDDKVCVLGRNYGATTTRPAAAGKRCTRASAVACETAMNALDRRTAGPSVSRSITIERKLGRIDRSNAVRSWTIGTAGMRKNRLVKYEFDDRNTSHDRLAARAVSTCQRGSLAPINCRRCVPYLCVIGSRALRQRNFFAGEVVFE